jgi:dinuclear metal center YbgI/SA1388 family protein
MGNDIIAAQGAIRQSSHERGGAGSLPTSEIRALHAQGAAGAAVDRRMLLSTLDGWLQPERFRDYAPNGLQVEGRDEIRRVVCGVTASAALIAQAIELQADAILVHHGWFWRNEDPRVLGWRRERLRQVLAADLNLFAYHLPLDAHAEWGNNAQLARVLDLIPLPAEVSGARWGEQQLGWMAELPETTSAASFALWAGERLGRPALLLGPDRPVRRIAWCTGGAQGYFEAAIAAGADLYLSGEASEQTTHLARESGVAYVAAGHHATERYGVQALGAALAAALNIEAWWVDIDNPV